MQYHYVICYDTDTKEFSVDVETMLSRFDGNPVFDNVLGFWQGGFETSELEEYLAIEEHLAVTLNKKEN